MSDVILTDNPNDKHEIAFPLNNKKFVDLILNFLGKKEKLIYEEGLTFLIGRNDIEQFYYLLNDKLKKEQYSCLDHFLVTIEYNDKTRREISGIESLQRFLETRDVIPTNVTLTWNLIFQFPNAETIENQVIELTFFVKDPRSVYGDNGKVVLQINHTNQAWGVEVLNLFREKIKNVTVSEPNNLAFAKKIRKSYNTRIAPLYVMMYFLLFELFIIIYGSYNPKNEYYYPIAELIRHQNSSMDAIDVNIGVFAIDKMGPKTLAQAADKLIVNEDAKKALLLIAAKHEIRNSSANKIMGGILLLGVCVYIYALYLDKYIGFYGSTSYIFMTDKAEKVHKIEIEQKNKLQFYTISLVIFSALCGSFGNLIYQLLVEILL